MNSEHQEFEDEVRRIARLLWPIAEYSGAEMVGGRERDGVFVTEDMVHCVEATVSKAKQKAVDDIRKLLALIKQMRSKHPTKGVRGWFVTREEPTAEQRGVAQKHSDVLGALSFDQFRSKIVQSRTYLDLRRKYPFGSARDPETGAADDRTAFVEPVLLAGNGSRSNTENITALLGKGERVLLLGDYGSGKSFTGRELYLNEEKAFRQGKQRRFPIFLNLRDHHGQRDPVEALARHAREIGFPSPDQLVRAWRAGFTTLVLDGFDEIATLGWAGQVRKLRDIRYQSMELIRCFLKQTPPESGVLLSGREHFFDSDQEMLRALAIGETATVRRLAEFTDEQVSKYLASRGWKKPIPEWLPARPLLLAYLATHRGASQKDKTIMDDILEKAAEFTPAAGWDYLLKMISDREADIEAGIDGGSVRLILEKLASEARSQVDPVGPIAQDLILEVFKEVCGYSPDDRAMMLLQRLPGIGPLRPEDGTRQFVDSDLANAASAGEVYRFIEDPYTKRRERFLFQSGLSQLGVDVVTHLCMANGAGKGKLSTALRQAAQGAGQGVLTSDLVRVCMRTGSGYEGDKVYVREGVIPELEFEGDKADLRAIEFQDCLIASLDLPPFVSSEELPTFVRCYFGAVRGRVGRQDLPGNFAECEFESFAESARTTAAILDMSLPLGAKVMLTVLKKLFVQKGSGRKESALFRGLDHRGQRLVPGVLAVLSRENLAMKLKGASEPVWIPVRAQSARVLRLLGSPSTSNDSLLQQGAAVQE